jgi:branched-chain amino acid transport system ATP-binding protein
MLAIENLTAGYDGASIIQSVSLNIRPGEALAVLGRNGAGKSTLLKSILGLTRIHSGSVAFAGCRLNGMKPSDILCLGMAHVPEGRRIFPNLTVMENLRLGLTLRRDKADEKSKVEQIMEMFPVLKVRADSQGGLLSGGEQQMLAIARALVARPRLLLLDEPSLGLAPIVCEKIIDLLKRLPERGTSILLVEQDVRIALRLAQRFLVLESGHVAMEGPAARLASDPQLAVAYLGAN